MDAKLQNADTREVNCHLGSNPEHSHPQNPCFGIDDASAHDMAGIHATMTAPNRAKLPCNPRCSDFSLAITAQGIDSFDAIDEVAQSYGIDSSLPTSPIGFGSLLCAPRS